MENSLSKKTEIFLAFLFSTFTIIGYSYKISNSWNIITNNIVESIIFMFIFWIVYYIIIIGFEKIFDKICKKKLTKNRYINFIFEIHPFIAPALILLIFWIPYLIIKYPGTPGWDFYYYLNNYYQVDGGLTQHFPLVYVFMNIYVLKFGSLLGSNNLGLYLLTLIHSFSMLFSFSFIFCYYKKWNINYKYRIFTLLFLGINPLFGNYATTIYHDILFSSAFLVYVLIITDIILEGKLSIKKMIGFSIISLIICLSRKNGIYVVLPLNLLIFFKYKRLKFKFFLILPMICFALTEYYFSLHYYRTHIFEAMSVQFQTLARYSRDYHDDISEQEKYIIDGIIDYDRMPEYYNPKLVDPVRNNLGNYFYYENTEKGTFEKFWIIWIKLFFRHPDSYIQAVINNTYQLYYPYEKTTHIFFDVQDDKKYFSAIDFHEVESLQPAKNILKKLYYNFFEKIPIIRYIDDPGYYVWMFLILLGIVIKNKKDAIPMLPLVIIFLFCIIGPAIDYNARYVFPIIFSIIPLTAFYSYYINVNKIKEK